MAASAGGAEAEVVPPFGYVPMTLNRAWEEFRIAMKAKCIFYLEVEHRAEERQLANESLISKMKADSAFVTKNRAILESF